MATIALEGMIFHSKHGVFPEEKVLGARYEVDVYVNTSILKPGKTDNLADTIDYGAIYSIVADRMKQKHKLLEFLAYQLAHEILTTNANIHSVKVRVSKMHPPLGGLCNKTFVEYCTEENQ